MKKIFTPAALLLLNLSNPFAQGLDTTNWFPYKTGDLWEYNVIEGFSVVDTFQIINIKDSVDENGIVHLTQLRRYINPVQSFYETFYIDTGNQFVYGYHIDFDSVLIYKLNAAQGDQWVIKKRDGSGFIYEMARVNSIYRDFLFGGSIDFMDIFYYLAVDSTDTSGLDRHGVTLAKGFGLYFFGSFGFLRHYLRGAVIDSTLYGDTTQIVTTIENYPHVLLPDNLELLQNYPNPFNPFTTIRFRLKTSSDISLIIYDNSGNEIRKLIDVIFFHPGEYQIIWDGKNNKGIKAASGIYFYRLSNGQQNFVRSMVLLK